MNNPRFLILHAALFAAFVPLGVASVQAADAQNAAKEKERSLIEVLRSGTKPEKAIACKQLAIYGSGDAVAELAPLLADEQLASWARIALEAIPGPEADATLRKATETVKGRLLVGTINSIGVRRDAGAVDQLTAHLQDQDAAVAAAAAVALGHIGNSAATKTLRQSLPATPGAVQSAVAEGCILCAERLMAEGKMKEAAEIYDEVRRAAVPKPRIIEATRGAILARQAGGIPLLIEQLESADKGFFQIGLGVARELPGREVADALAAELSRTTPERAALLMRALADRNERGTPVAVLAAAKTGAKPVRIAAIGFIGKSGDAESLSTLLEVAADNDDELAQAAKLALKSLPGENVNAEVAARLSTAKGKAVLVLLEIIGQRRIGGATDALRKLLDSPDAEIRRATLTALGETIAPQDLSTLIAQVVAPKDSGDLEVALKALNAAAVRMPDREACATELAAALPRASAATKVKLLEILGAVGGTKALDTIADAVKGDNEDLKDAGSRLLGQWMSVDAAPVLLDLAKNSRDEKYQSRLMRGYIRLARQFVIPAPQRAEMCAAALAATNRLAEQKLVLAVLERYPSIDALKVTVKAAANPALKQEAGRVALVIAQKLGGDSPEVRKVLSDAGIELLKIEIVKAEYGADAAQKDVTEALKKLVHGLPLIGLPSENYNESFGGDPAPGTVKQLKVQYRINGKAGDASFPENAPIVLPMPK